MFFQMFYLSRFAILISWTLHRRLCINMNEFVHKTWTSSIHNNLFANNAVAASFCKIREYGEWHAWKFMLQNIPASIILSVSGKS